MIKLIKNVEDISAQENFDRIEGFLWDEAIFKAKFKFFSISLTSPSYPASVKFRHNLGFVPKDLLETSRITTGSLSWEYADFDKEFIEATITAPCVVRLFLGCYSEGRTV